MEKALNDGCLSLKKALDEDPRFIRLKEAEMVALKDEGVIRLIARKEACLERYSSLLSVKNRDDEEVKAAEKELAEAKLALDSHPLVKEYNDCYIAVKDLTMEINDIIFGPFQRKVLDIEVK